jgi:phosphoglucosamine mutase
MAKHFGTDGVRGVAGVDLTSDLAQRLGRAAGQAFGARTALIARDTRLSGPELEAACASGLAEAGVNVRLAGVLPSPAVSHLVRLHGYDLGVVVSASHNPPQDNGLKFYDARGLKLSPQEEEGVEALLDAPLAPARREDLLTAETQRAQRKSVSELNPNPKAVESSLQVSSANSAALRWTRDAQDTYCRGNVTTDPEAEGRYRSFLRAAVPALSLARWRIALDCAFGATSQLAPDLFRDLGASLILLGEEPDGARINATGAAALGPLERVVREEGVHIGIAFDGDGDRAMFVTGRGQIVEGDRLLAAFAPLLWGWQDLATPAVVFTVLANMGAERYLVDRGFRVVRVPVGDRNVSWAMCEDGTELGGEPSGHIVFRRHAPTGDGILTALLVLQALERAGTSLDDLVAPVPVHPQVREDVRVTDRDAAFADPAVQKAVADGEKMLADHGRLIVRASGTQPVVRVFAEGPDEALLRRAVATVAQALDRFQD